MCRLGSVLAGGLIVALVGCGSGGKPSTPAAQKSDPAKPPTTQKQELTNKEKIIGTWEVSKSGGGAPPGAVVTFTADGKFKMTAKMGDKELTADGTYVVDGDKFTTTMKMGDKEEKETMTIKKLTETEFVTEDKDKKIDEFKKK